MRRSLLFLTMVVFFLSACAPESTVPAWEPAQQVDSHPLFADGSRNHAGLAVNQPVMPALVEAVSFHPVLDKPPKTEKPKKTEKPPKKTGEPPVKTDKPPKKTEKPPKTTNEPPETTPEPPEATLEPQDSTAPPGIASSRKVRALDLDVPQKESDPLHVELLSSGYSLLQSASLADGQSVVFSAYLYFRENIHETISRTTWVLAFYRWDGQNNILLGTAYPSPLADHLPLYPRHYRLVDWSHPDSSLANTLAPVKLDEALRSRFGLNGFASDINRNQRPEFVLAAEYCPLICLKPSYALDFFEINPRHRITNLSQGLPGRLTLETSTAAAQGSAGAGPVSLRVYDIYPYDAFSQIRLPYEVTWRGEAFIDETGKQVGTHLAALDGLFSFLKSRMGQPLASNDVETSLWQQLLMYQQRGMRPEGLAAFLAVTDPANWPGSDRPTQCWLALARAHVQEKARRQDEFILFPSRNDLFGSNPSVPLSRLVSSLGGRGYDVSACQVFVVR